MYINRTKPMSWLVFVYTNIWFMYCFSYRFSCTLVHDTTLVCLEKANSYVLMIHAKLSTYLTVYQIHNAKFSQSSCYFWCDGQYEYRINFDPLFSGKKVYHSLRGASRWTLSTDLIGITRLTTTICVVMKIPNGTGWVQAYYCDN